MKKLKVIIIMIVVLMVFNASASEMQNLPEETSVTSEQSVETLDSSMQIEQAMVLFEGVETSFCEETFEDT